MRKDIRRARAQVSVSFGQVSYKKVFQELFGESIEVGRITDLAGDNL